MFLAALVASPPSLLHPGEENAKNKSKTEGHFPTGRGVTMKNKIPEKINEGGDGESQDKKQDKINEYTLDFHLTPPANVDSLSLGENKILMSF